MVYLQDALTTAELQEVDSGIVSELGVKYFSAKH